MLRRPSSAWQATSRSALLTRRHHKHKTLDLACKLEAEQLLADWERIAAKRTVGLSAERVVAFHEGRRRDAACFPFLGKGRDHEMDIPAEMSVEGLFGRMAFKANREREIIHYTWYCTAPFLFTSGFL